MPDSPGGIERLPWLPVMWEHPSSRSIPGSHPRGTPDWDPRPPSLPLLPPFPSFLIQLQLCVPFGKDTVVQVLQRHQTGISASSWGQIPLPQPQEGLVLPPTSAPQPQPGFMLDEGMRCRQLCKRGTAWKAPVALPAPMAHVPPGGPRGWGLSRAPRHGPSKTELQDKREGVTPHRNPHSPCSNPPPPRSLPAHPSPWSTAWDAPNPHPEPAVGAATRQQSSSPPPWPSTQANLSHSQGCAELCPSRSAELPGTAQFPSLAPTSLGTRQDKHRIWGQQVTPVLCHHGMSQRHVSHPPRGNCFTTCSNRHQPGALPRAGRA